jgi:thiosulfate reductase cytochrome b subunit
VSYCFAKWISWLISFCISEICSWIIAWKFGGCKIILTPLYMRELWIFIYNFMSLQSFTSQREFTLSVRASLFLSLLKSPTESWVNMSRCTFNWFDWLLSKIKLYWFCISVSTKGYRISFHCFCFLNAWIVSRNLWKKFQPILSYNW